MSKPVSYASSDPRNYARYSSGLWCMVVNHQHGILLQVNPATVQNIWTLVHTIKGGELLLKFEKK